MSSIVIKGNTSGQIELAAPDVAGSTTLTLPTGSGTVITDTAPKAGNVIQVVNATSSTNFTTTSTTLQDTGFSASITPSSSSSKILVIVNYNIYAAQNGQGQNYVYCRGSLARGSTQLQEARLASNSGTTSMVDAGTQATIVYLDSPATTSSTTYKLFVSALAFNFYVSMNWVPSISSFTLMEIAG